MKKTGVTYDMQKLDEAVSSLAGHGSLQERLSNAMIPLLVLSTGGGMKNSKRASELEAILALPGGLRASQLDDEAAQEMARAIVDLLNGNWHDTVYALEDEVERLNERRN